MSTGQNVTRKLRAILSADVKGYSLLMADDEVHTIEILKKYRQIMSSLIDQHSGRVVDNPGDNVLSEFSSAVDAVNCAVQIQSRLKKENTKFVEDRRLQFRLQDEITLNIIKEVGIILVGGKQGIERTANIDDLGLAIQGLKIRGLLFKGEKEANQLAQKELINLRKLYPNNTILYTSLGYTYLMELWYDTCDNPIGCIGKATEAARKALSLDENSSDAHLLSGYIFLMKKEHDKAIAAVKHALKLNPNSADAYSMLGAILGHSDRPLEAIDFCNKAIRLNPLPPASYLSTLGHAYRWAELYEEAVRSYKESIEIEPYIYSYVGLAASYSLLGRDKEACEAALEVRKINPEFSLAEYNKVIPQINKSKQQIYINALRKAGLPD